MFGERDTLQPHKGEMIAAFYAPEESWYRGLVVDVTEDKVKVLECKINVFLGIHAWCCTQSSMT